VDCVASRLELLNCLARASNCLEQLEIIQRIKNENRFFSRLWDKSVGTSTGDRITTGALCSKCNTWYKQKCVTILNCFKVHCGGDIGLFLTVNGVNGRIVGGRIVLGEFKLKCTHPSNE
jgi:hypothetical protein